MQVATQMPETVEDLLEVRGLNGQLSKEMMSSLVDAMNEARLAPKETFPAAPEREKPLPATQEACLDQLKLLLRQCCDDAHVVARLVAHKDELEALVRGTITLEQSSFGQGWRYDVFGKAAQGMLSGKRSARVVEHRGGYGLVWSDAS